MYRYFMKTLPRNAFALLSVFALFVASLSPSFAATKEQAGAYVEALGNNAISILSNKNLSKEKKKQDIEKLFRENVDIQWIGKFVLGRFWRQISEEQKKNYLKEYETFLVRHYATRFTDYTSGSFTITGIRDDGDNEFFVNMQIKSDEAGEEPIIVDYRVRHDKGTKNQFMIFDIIVEGVSMITTQRSEFNSVMTNKGIEYLTSQLAKKSGSVDTKPR